MQKQHYKGIDGLRTIACIGIIMMHVLINGDYQLTGYVCEALIPAFTNFVFLFMVISAFGLCSGYRDSFLNGQISLERFYKKRYSKILPFFAVLVLLDFLMSPGLNTLIEAAADVTLLFGLFPNSISVIGVGWFLGLIFAFYLIFPFYCVLMKDTRRAWITLAVSLFFNYAGAYYFQIGRENIMYSSCYFVAGGLIYLYREKLTDFSKVQPWLSLGILAVSVGLYFSIGADTIFLLAVSCSMLIFALGREKGVLVNPATSFISSVSMELYLSHMIIFRILERLRLTYLFQSRLLCYISTVSLTVFGAIVFSVVLKQILHYIGQLIQTSLSDKTDNL